MRWREMRDTDKQTQNAHVHDVTAHAATDRRSQRSQSTPVSVVSGCGHVGSSGPGLSADGVSFEFAHLVENFSCARSRSCACLVSCCSKKKGSR